MLGQRGSDPMKGEWSLPGGAVDVGETLEAAVAREVFEETRLVVDVGPVVEVLDSIRRDVDGRVEYHFVIVDYRCRVRGGTATAGSDAEDLRWVEVADLERYGLTDVALKVIRKATNLDG